MRSPYTFLIFSVSVATMLQLGADVDRESLKYAPAYEIPVR